MRPVSPMMSIQRVSLHNRAKEHINTGDYSEAEYLLQTATQKYGVHVLLLTDLAMTYLLQKKMVLFCETVLLLQHEFLMADSELSEESFCLTALFLGSSFERMASHDQALQCYEQAYMFAYENEELHNQALREFERLKKQISHVH